MPQPSYAYGVARVRVLETKLLSRERIERMVDAPSAADVLRILSETDYASLVAELASPYEYEKLLAQETKQVHAFIEEISPNTVITDLFFLKYDFHNLKVLLKDKYLENGADSLPITEMGTIPLETLEAGIVSQDYEGLPPFMIPAVEKIDHMFTLRIDPQQIDIILDRAMYEYIFKVCVKEKNSFVIEYFRRQVDFINIRSFLRVKRLGRGFDFLEELFLPYGKLDITFYSDLIDQPYEQLIADLSHSFYDGIIVQGVEDFTRDGNLTTFERLMDNYLLDYVRAAKANPFGIEPILGYLLAKENEIKLIRIIMVGKINNIPTEKIRERLRDVYV